MSDLLSEEELEAALRRTGAERYHTLHPFHVMMNRGQLTRAQLQAWALNRYCYQAAIPIKDAVIMSRMEEPKMRRIWRQRIVDHDGDDTDEGGIARWLLLCTALGLSRDDVLAQKGVLPGCRFAVGAYIEFVRTRPLLEAIASSLTELFAPAAIGERTVSLLSHYDFISKDVLAYFDRRLTQAPRDAGFALDYVKRHARTAAEQRAVVAALEFKCSVLWAQLDALHHAYVSPGLVPPGALRPDADG